MNSKQKPPATDKKAPPQAEEKKSEGKETPVFPIVGIGASAGGLAAFESFFSGMPLDVEPGMAFVLVQHLAPDHKSILTDLIQRYTRMQVFEVTDGITVQPNCAYIIPPNCDMAFLNGSLQLMEPSAPRGLRLPIDFFFRSLAQDQQERAICIVLSGTGSDGTMGIRAIKGEGGMVMAQTPASTEFDGMPRSALSTGLVDYELEPAEMPAQLMAYVSHAFQSQYNPEATPQPQTENSLKKLLILLRNHTNHDFSQYKLSTINRRVERRMAVNEINSIEKYIKYSQYNPAEIEMLFRDMLIGVTNFFRDPAAFNILEEKIIPEIFNNKPPGSLIRVWCTGCSTGEEAYSIAILLQEKLEALRKNYKVQVFATDIDSQAIAIARAGVYPASISPDITPERLSRFFTNEADDNVYRIHKSIRDMVVFSEQDVIKDPPFSKLDMISCRNLMIYMSAGLQKKLIPLFHYALNPNGILFLGTSETTGDFNDLFATIDRKAKIYQRKEDYHGAQRTALNRFLPPMMEMQSTPPIHRGKSAEIGKISPKEITEYALLKQIAPAAALVNEKGEILYIHGRTGMYLEPAPGETGINNVLKMAREGLRRELTTALHKTVQTKEMVYLAGLRVKTNGDFSAVDLTVCPVSARSAGTIEAQLYLVILAAGQQQPLPLIDQKLTSDMKNADYEINLAALKQELRAKEEYLQTTNEELETSNEELKSSNEEMQSINEELQSTNEELETSKEELQSVNEELSTVNAELQTKILDLSRANNDMNNLLAGTGIGTIFVDHQLRILRFTPAVTKIINLIQSDIGRPVGHLVSNLSDYNQLSDDVKGVLNTLIPKEIEVKSKKNKHFTLRIQPYRTLENVIEGAVITFVDITDKKNLQKSYDENLGLNKLAIVIRDLADAVIQYDLKGNIISLNGKAKKLYGAENEHSVRKLDDLLPENKQDGHWDEIRLLANSNQLKSIQAARLTKDKKTIQVWLTATPLLNEEGCVYAIMTTERETA